MKRNFKDERGRKPFIIANQRIRADELRVVTDQGEQLGIMQKNQAQQKADADGLDLVLIVPNANPPVAKIISINKYNYEIKKREKDFKMSNTSDAQQTCFFKSSSADTEPPTQPPRPRRDPGHGLCYSRK